MFWCLLQLDHWQLFFLIFIDALLLISDLPLHLSWVWNVFLTSPSRLTPICKLHRTLILPLSIVQLLLLLSWPVSHHYSSWALFISSEGGYIAWCWIQLNRLQFLVDLVILFNFFSQTTLVMGWSKMNLFLLYEADRTWINWKCRILIFFHDWKYQLFIRCYSLFQSLL